MLVSIVLFLLKENNCNSISRGKSLIYSKTESLNQFWFFSFYTKKICCKYFKSINTRNCFYISFCIRHVIDLLHKAIACCQLFGILVLLKAFCSLITEFVFVFYFIPFIRQNIILNLVKVFVYSFMEFIVNWKNVNCIKLPKNKFDVL